MRSISIGKFGLLAAMLAAVSACTSTSSRVTTTYYSIGGKTGADLDREIATKGPMKGHALASAAIKFVPVAISYDKSDAGCSYKTARFRIDANITLPRWSNQNSSDPGLRTAWRFLAEYAREHEQVHIDIAEEHARKLGEQLEALAPRKTCEALDAAGQQVLKRVKRDHNRAQLAFDAAENKRLAALYN